MHGELSDLLVYMYGVCVRVRAFADVGIKICPEHSTILHI